MVSSAQTGKAVLAAEQNWMASKLLLKNKSVAKVNDWDYHSQQNSQRNGGETGEVGKSNIVNRFLRKDKKVLVLHAPRIGQPLRGLSTSAGKFWGRARLCARKRK